MKICIDIDGTILYTLYHPKRKIPYTVLSHNQKMVDKINDLYEKGNQIILHTARHWDKLDLTISQLKDINVKYTTLVMGKPVADFYVDDKAILPDDFVLLEDKKHVE